MVEHQPSKLDTWVRFPSPALYGNSHTRYSSRSICNINFIPSTHDIHAVNAIVVQLVVRHLAKVEVAGSSPVYRFFCYAKTEQEEFCYDR